MLKNFKTIDSKTKKILSPFIGNKFSSKLVSKWRPVFQLSFKNNKNLRLDILSNQDKTTEYHNLILEKGFTFVPKIEQEIAFNNYVFKISEWVDGDLYDELKSRNEIKKEMFIELGKSLGMLNSITNLEGFFLHNDDITLRNILWNGKCKMFDLDRLCFEKVPENSLLKILLKRVIVKEHIDLILEGYKEYRDIKLITELCNNKNWRWK